MEIRVLADSPDTGKMRNSFPCRIFRIREVRRNMNIPIGEGTLHGIKPASDAGFTPIDFLTSPDQTNHHGPILMSVQIRD